MTLRSFSSSSSGLLSISVRSAAAAYALPF